MKKNIYLFYGENELQAKEKIRSWSGKFVEKYGEDSLERFDLKEGRNFDFKKFQNNLKNLPFFCEKKMVIVENFFLKGSKSELSGMAESIDSIPEFVFLVFLESEKNPDKRSSLYKKIKKFGNIEEFKKLSPNETINWVLKFANQEEINLKSQETSFLVNYCGTALKKLKNELIKLKTYKLQKPNNSLISKEDIQNICSPTISSSIFEFTDYLGNKNHHQALKILERLKQSGEDPIMIFFMIVRQFRILIQIKILQNNQLRENEITKKTKLHPFVVKKSCQQIQKFKFQELKKIYKKLLQIDKKIKTGKTTNYYLAISQLILKISKDP